MNERVKEEAQGCTACKEVDNPFKGTRLSHQYIIQQVIGSGSFGTVYRCLSKSSEEVVAIKSYLKGSSQSDIAYQALVRQECEIIKRVNCPNIIGFRGYHETSDHIFIILEYCSGGDLNAFLAKWKESNKRPFKDREIITILKGILNGLHYLHTKERIIHRDIKPGKSSLSQSEHPHSFCQHEGHPGVRYLHF